MVQRVFEADNGGRNDLYLTALYTNAITGRDELNGIGLPDYVPFDVSDYSVRFLFGMPSNGFLQLDAKIKSIAVVPDPPITQLFFLAVLGLVLRKGLIINADSPPRRLNMHFSWL